MQARPATVPRMVILAPQSTTVGFRNSVTGSYTAIATQSRQEDKKRRSTQNKCDSYTVTAKH